MSQTIGHYEIVKELGRGGMGVVYKAHEQSLGRFVAIKMLGDQVVSDPNIRARFLREARSAASLNHPNIVQIFFVGEDEGRPFFAMEYVEGISLADAIRSEQQMAPKRAAGILIQAASGLARAHDQGIIHRDIKPGNIMMDTHGMVKLADFGIAHLTDAKEKLTATGHFLGTPGYLSPEVCLGKPIENRSDIFSLGIVYYEMLTGKTPFRADSPLAMLKEVVELEVPDPRGLNANVDLDSHLILSKMVAKSPDERYGDCHLLIEDLKRYLGNEAIATTIPAAAAAPPIPPTIAIDSAQANAAYDQPTAPMTVPAGEGSAEELQPTVEIPVKEPASTVPKAPPPPPPFEEPAPVAPPPIRSQAPPSSNKKGPALILLAVAALAVLGFGGWWLTQDKGAEQPIAEPESRVASNNILSDANADTKETPYQAKEGQPTGDMDTGTTSNASHTPQTSEPQNEPEPTKEGTGSTVSPTVVTSNTVAAGPASSSSASTVGQVDLKPGQTKVAVIPKQGSNQQSQPLSMPTSTTSSSKTSTARPEPKSAPTLPTNPKVDLVVVGDPLLASSVGKHLAQLLKDDGLSVARRKSEGGDVHSLGPKTSAMGYDLLIVAEVTFLDERELQYMGRSSKAYLSEVTYQTWWPAGKELLDDRSEQVEYTSLNADKKGEASALAVIDEILQSFRNN